MSEIKVCGHTPADTDSVCTPIAYAWFLSQFVGKPAVAVVKGKLNKETKLILEKLSVAEPLVIEKISPDDEVVLIDTTNPAELIPGVEGAKIIKIIDHHKLSGLSTQNPIEVTILPYGCTATVVWEEISAHSIKSIPAHIAGLLLAAIISDTLNLTSPTTTDKDKSAAEILADISGLNRDELAAEMFAAKSDVSDLTAAEILKLDYKDFQFGEENYRIAVVETTSPDQILSRQEELQAEIEKSAADHGQMLFVIDILRQNAILIASSSAKELASKAFAQEWDASGMMILPGIVSRKKQIIPQLEAAVDHR